MSVQKILAQAEKFFDKRKYSEALEKYLEAYKSDSANETIINRLVRCYVELGRQVEAAEFVKKQAKSASQLGRVQKAAALYKQAYQLNPNDSDLLQALAIESEQAGKAPEAIQYASELLGRYISKKMYGKATEIISLLVRLTVGKTEYKAAWLEAQLYAMTDNTLPGLVASLVGPPGVSAKEVPMLGEAATIEPEHEASIEKIAQYMPHNPLAQYAVAWMSYAKNKKTKSFAYIKRTIECEPNYTLAYSLLAKILSEAKKIKAAKFVIEQARRKIAGDKNTEARIVNEVLQKVIDANAELKELMDDGGEIDSAKFLHDIDAKKYPFAGGDAPPPPPEAADKPEVAEKVEATAVEVAAPAVAAEVIAPPVPPPVPPGMPPIPNAKPVVAAEQSVAATAAPTPAPASESASPKMPVVNADGTIEITFNFEKTKAETPTAQNPFIIDTQTGLSASILADPTNISTINQFETDKSTEKASPESTPEAPKGQAIVFQSIPGIEKKDETIDLGDDLLDGKTQMISSMVASQPTAIMEGHAALASAEAKNNNVPPMKLIDIEEVFEKIKTYIAEGKLRVARKLLMALKKTKADRQKISEYLARIRGREIGEDKANKKNSITDNFFLQAQIEVDQGAKGHSMNVEEFLQHSSDALPDEKTNIDLGIAHLEMGLPKEAEQFFIKVIDSQNIENKAESLYLLARALAEQKKYIEAILYLKKLVGNAELEPVKKIEAYYVLAETYEILKDQEKANIFYKIVSDIDPGYRDIKAKIPKGSDG